MSERSIAERIVELIRDGAETAADLEVDLNFSMSKYKISAHLSNLANAGRIRKIGEMRRGGRGTPAHRYAIAEPTAEARHG